MNIQLSWSDFRQKCIINKKLKIQFNETDNNYDLFASENGITYECILFKQFPRHSDLVDFENNYKDAANKKDDVNVVFSDNANLDAFSRLRISAPTVMFDSQMRYGLQPFLWDTINTGTASATHLSNESSASMSVGTASGDKCVRCTRQWIKYQPGKSQLIFMTFLFGSAKTNVTRRVGYFDEYNGIFLEQTIANIYLVKRSYISGAVVEERIEQASWNIDKMNGGGISGIRLDLSKVQILAVDLQWLGVGRIRCSLSINGIQYYIHSFVHANLITSVYMSTASLPVRYEIFNTGIAASSSTMKQICASVMSEGGSSLQDTTGFGFASKTSAGRIVTSTIKLPVISVRLKSLFGGIANRIAVLPLRIDIYSSATIEWEFTRNATLTAPSWVSVDAESGCERDILATAVSGGIVIDEGYVVSTSKGQNISLELKYPFTLDAAGNISDIFTIACISITGNSTVYCTISWKEVY